MSAEDEVIFQEFIDSSFGAYHDDLINFATVLVNGHEAFISTNCPCFVSSKGNVTKGERLTTATHLGYFAANGEDIPYDRPYAKIVYS